jgi:hypothetical protein
MATFRTTDLKEFQDLLHKEVVEFEFYKKDGSVRQAKGTLLPSYLPPVTGGSTGGGGRKGGDNTCVYYDLDKNNFRCFIKDLFIGAY